ncbi:predicted protein [Sclerotinia sclerotiorum 1980 UF-70]|uniref:Uncharacterized protein n=1 Tax=Sclerotinia sclerotiorum (strain ATCC 18683 / 1980 / Ss-1) TaxID=665079 RepID=A7F8P4_SCLS1|nr:predicted protein [Sclerotinia sclerotiorum 1980 UF-70]EDN99115.1 predicted protein [Sclerotinia sclerotiorum 1980 UF-70]
MGDYHPSTGVTNVGKGPVSYSTYKSPYGPNGLTLAGFGASAGFFALFFFSDIPKVRNDIMVKIPIIGDRWRREIPASDNCFCNCFLGREDGVKTKSAWETKYQPVQKRLYEINFTFTLIPVSSYLHLLPM